MGKASKWFRGLFGLKKTSSPSSTSRPSSKDKRRWSFIKSYREKDHPNDTPKFVVYDQAHDRTANDTNRSAAAASVDHDRHAIAVAAATAAVAEAAVAAAQAAAAVVRLTRDGGGGGAVKMNTVANVSEEWAAVKIQSAFRGCLARRALRALKGLVKLQALVRGHIERKRTGEWLHRMQTLMQAQARAIVGRSVQVPELQHSSSSKSSHFHHPGPATPEKFEHVIRTKSRKHEQSSLLRKNSSKSNGRGASSDERSGDLRSSSVRNSATTDDEKSDKVLKIDNGKPHVTIKRRNLFHSSDLNSHSFTTSKDSTSHLTVPSPSSYEVVQSSTTLKLQNNDNDIEENSFCTANNSPQFYSAASSRGGGSSRRSPFTPTKSDGSRSFLSGYSDFPNYMSYTESSKAKVRSLSAPKQRPQYERSSSTKRYSIHHGFGEPRQSSTTQRISALHANFMNKAYPGSGRLDKLGMPIGYRY